MKYLQPAATVTKIVFAALGIPIVFAIGITSWPALLLYVGLNLLLWLVCKFVFKLIADYANSRAQKQKEAQS